jgi:hypothetical protein
VRQCDGLQGRSLRGEPMEELVFTSFFEFSRKQDESGVADSSCDARLMSCDEQRNAQWHDRTGIEYQRDQICSPELSFLAAGEARFQ